MDATGHTQIIQSNSSSCEYFVENEGCSARHYVIPTTTEIYPEKSL